MQSFRGYAKYYDMIYRKKPYAAEAMEVYRMAGKPKRILDIGAGTGRHARTWCRFAEVMCVEPSEEMVKVAYKHKNITYFVGQVTEFFECFQYTFDAAFAMFNVLGYIGYIGGVFLHLPLKLGGYFIFDIWEPGPGQKPTVVIRKFKDFIRLVVPLEDPYYRIFIIKGNRIVVDEYHQVEVFQRESIEKMASVCGFKVCSRKRLGGWSCRYKLQKVKEVL